MQKFKCDKIPSSTVMIPFKKEHDQFEDSISDQNLVNQLLAHMDVYIQNGMLNRAFKILMLKRQHLKSSNTPTIAVYNILMEAYVTKPYMEKVFEIYNLLNEDSVKPDAQTYALMFQVIGNMKAHKKQAGKLISR